MQVKNARKCLLFHQLKWNQDPNYNSFTEMGQIMLSFRSLGTMLVFSSLSLSWLLPIRKALQPRPLGSNCWWTEQKALLLGWPEQPLSALARGTGGWGWASCPIFLAQQHASLQPLPLFLGEASAGAARPAYLARRSQRQKYEGVCGQAGWQATGSALFSWATGLPSWLRQLASKRSALPSPGNRRVPPGHTPPSRPLPHQASPVLEPALHEGH